MISGVVYYWIYHSILDAVKRVPGWPWEIQLDEQKEAQLRDHAEKSGHLGNIKASS